MTATEVSPANDVITAIDEFLRLVAQVRTEKRRESEPRDPLRRLENRLLEMRSALT